MDKYNDYLKEQFNIVQKVQGDGVEYEFMISFYNLGGKLAGRVEISVALWQQHDEMTIANMANKTVRFISVCLMLLFS